MFEIALEVDFVIGVFTRIAVVYGGAPIAKQHREIPRQDLGNIPRMQKGLHSRGCTQSWLAENDEKMIMNMHRGMDKYLVAPTEG